MRHVNPVVKITIITSSEGKALEKFTKELNFAKNYLNQTLQIKEIKTKLLQTIRRSHTEFEDCKLIIDGLQDFHNDTEVKISNSNEATKLEFELNVILNIRKTTVDQPSKPSG